MGVLAVFLVGFMGSGKSTVGQELARRHRWDFVDLDALIKTREQASIPEIFARAGEAGFRAAETSALLAVTESLKTDTVVALGGGAFAQETNRSLIGNWPSVFLEAPLDELWRRSAEQETPGRPLRKDREQFSRLYAQRLPFYRQATATIETFGKEIDTICREVEQRLCLPAPYADLAYRQPDSADSESGGLK